jgi:tRNA threonylcarbamoyladenosine biosynthesis protein TsaB
MGERRILAIETSGRAGSVAALAGNKLLCEKDLAPDQRSAQSLAPAMQTLLTLVGWKPREVEVVAIATGPGSFTGLRVGVTTAKAFAYAVQARIIGIKTLEVVAAQAPLGEGPVATVIDAGRNEVFSAVYGFGPEGLPEPIVAPRILTVEAWIETLRPPCRVAGPALAKLAGRLPAEVQWMAPEFWMPRAGTVGRLAAARDVRGAHDDLWQLVPFYLRRSAAEEQWDARPAK